VIFGSLIGAGSGGLAGWTYSRGKAGQCKSLVIDKIQLHQDNTNDSKGIGSTMHEGTGSLEPITSLKQYNVVIRVDSLPKSNRCASVGSTMLDCWMNETRFCADAYSVQFESEEVLLSLLESFEALQSDSS